MDLLEGYNVDDMSTNATFFHNMKNKKLIIMQIMQNHSIYFVYKVTWIRVKFYNELYFVTLLITTTRNKCKKRFDNLTNIYEDF